MNARDFCFYLGCIAVALFPYYGISPIDVEVVSGNYGYERTRIKRPDVDLIDASNATWIVENDKNPYPFLVQDARRDGIILQGGEIVGEVPLNEEWEDVYDEGNSASVYSRDNDEVIITGWKITQPWDAIRLRGDDDYTFLIEDVWVENARDDGVENDDGLGGVIRNSLFDGVHVGISLSDSGTPNQSDRVVTLDGVLIRMRLDIYKGDLTHHSLFKVDKKRNKSPRLDLRNSVFAIADVDHEGQERLSIAWGNVINSESNYFLNLSDDALPRDYPLPPKDGFTILQGEEAREFWELARAAWLDEPQPMPDPNRPLTVSGLIDLLQELPGDMTVPLETTVGELVGSDPKPERSDGDDEG